MKNGLFFASMVLLIGLTGCEGTANNNIVAEIFIGNEWGMVLLSIILILPSIFAILTEKGTRFYVAFFRRRRRFWQNNEITEFDLVMAKFSAYITLVLGVFIFAFSLYYLFSY